MSSHALANLHQLNQILKYHSESDECLTCQLSYPQGIRTIHLNYMY